MSPDTETTDQGEQTLVPGVAPVTARDRLQLRLGQKMQPKRTQRPADFGLFDLGARAQADLF